MPQPTDAPSPAADPRPGTYGDLAPAPARRPGVRLPAWLAVAIVALFAAGAVYAGWLMLRPAPKVDLTQYESNDARGRGGPLRPGGGPPRIAMTEGVVLNPDGTGSAQTATFSIGFTVLPKPSLSAMSKAAPPVAERPVIRARKRVLDDKAVRQTAGVTDAQIVKLQATTVAQPKAVDPATRAKLLDAWAKLRAADAADRPAAEKAVMDVVKDAAARHAVASDAAFKQYGDQIRAVLTPDQLAKLKDAR